MSKGFLQKQLQGKTFSGQKEFIRRFLENEGITPPGEIRKKYVDFSKQGEPIDVGFAKPMTIRYSVLDSAGREIYYLDEREITHIIVNRIDSFQEEAIQYLSDIPQIIRTTRPEIFREGKKLIYTSRKKYPFAEYPLNAYMRVVVKKYKNIYYVDTCYPTLPKLWG